MIREYTNQCVVGKRIYIPGMAAHIIYVEVYNMSKVFIPKQYKKEPTTIRLTPENAFISCFQPIFIYISTVYIFAVNY